MDNKYFIYIAVSIWERDLSIDGILYPNIKAFLVALYELSPVKGRIFGDNVLSYMTYYLRGRRYGNEANDLLFNQVIKDLTDMFPEEAKDVVTTDDLGIELIEGELVDRLKIVEAKAVKEKGPIAEWPQIRIAAFVEIMFERKWFIEKKQRMATPKGFAKARYDKDVTNQLHPTKEAARNRNKHLLQRYFK